MEARPVYGVFCVRGVYGVRSGLHQLGQAKGQEPWNVSTAQHELPTVDSVLNK